MNETTKTIMSELFKEKKGKREVVKQIASRRRSYSVTHYLRMVEKKSGSEMTATELKRMLYHIAKEGQFGFTNVVVQNGRVYNYSLAA